MAQFARPDADQATGAWSATPLWSKVDEGTPGDGTTISSDDNTSPDNADLRLSDVVDPQASTGHVIRAEWNKSGSGGHAINAVCELWQGVPGTGTLVATLSVTGIGATEQTDTHTLSGAEADAITDYADLYLRVSRQGDTGGNPNGRRSLVVDAVELEVPDANTDRTGRASWAELEVPNAPRAGRVSWSELEAPDAPRAGRVSWAEAELPDALRAGRISWSELEAPDAPRSGRISWSELETPETTRAGRVSWSELEVPDAERSGRLSWSEMEVSDPPRAGRVSWAELETPPAPRAGRISWSEMETPDAARTGRVSWSEIELSDAPRAGRLSWAAFEVPDVGGEETPNWKRSHRDNYIGFGIGAGFD